MFESPRDVQQVEFLGKQLNLSHFLKNCYEIATRETFGHLLIDLDPKTSDCLCFCSNITVPGPSVFYIPSDKADITHISNEQEKFSILKRLVLLSDPEFRKFLRTSDENTLLVLSECFCIVIRGHVKHQINNLMQHEIVFRTVLRKNVPVEKKRALLLTKTGFGLVRIIIFIFASSI